MDYKHRREGQKRIYEISGWEAYDPNLIEPDPDEDIGEEPNEDSETGVLV